MGVDLHHILSSSRGPRRAVAKPAWTLSRLMRFRRARTLLMALTLFWIWVWLGSASMIAGLFHLPLWAMLATYALAVAVLVSFPLALGATVQMYLMRSCPAPARGTRPRTFLHAPEPAQADVVRLPRRPSPSSARKLSKGA